MSEKLTIEQWKELAQEAISYAQHRTSDCYNTHTLSGRVTGTICVCGLTRLAADIQQASRNDVD